MGKPEWMSDADWERNALKKYKLERSPLAFIDEVWKLRPQTLKLEYKTRYAFGLAQEGKAWDTFCETVRPEWFNEYQENIHITWQQTLVLFGIEKAIRNQVPMRVSIVSGHGIGKTALLSWLILWFLWVHPMAQVGATAPSSDQLYDVLWKELKKWIDKMPEEEGHNYKAFYKWETTHVRMVEALETWFARAKTSSKENTEALAGIHGPAVFAVADEASGVEEPIFETMEGSLTDPFTLVVVISNGTRNIGYFYDTHHRDASRWQCYAFDATDSPRVTQSSVDAWKEKYGEDSVQYAVRVKGRFPDEGTMDDKGYVQLFNEKDLRFVPHDANWKPVGRVIGALDASGEGQDVSAWCARDRQIVSVLHTQQTSNAIGMAAISVTLCDKYMIDPIDFVLDNFGEGANVSMEMALMTSQEKRPWRISPVNVGEPCEDEDQREFYINKRAEAYYKMMLWVRAGGSFMELPTPEATMRLKFELLSIRFKRTLSGRIQMMSKVEMKKLGFNSPNMADAISMTFLRPDGAKRSVWGIPQSELSNAQFDPNDTVGLND